MQREIYMTRDAQTTITDLPDNRAMLERVDHNHSSPSGTSADVPRE